MQKLEQTQNKTFLNESLSHEKFSEQNPTRRKHEKLSAKTLFDGGQPFNDESCVRERRRSKKKIHTYNTYNTYNQSIKEFLEDTHNQLKTHMTITVAPIVKRKFRLALLQNDPFSNMSEELERFMVAYVVDAMENQRQPKITQFFINKPQTVNIAEKVTVNKSEPLPDFSKMSDQELQESYDRAVAQQRHGRGMTLAFELKKRRGLYRAR